MLGLVHSLGGGPLSGTLSPLFGGLVLALQVHVLSLPVGPTVCSLNPSGMVGKFCPLEELAERAACICLRFTLG